MNTDFDIPKQVVDYKSLDIVGRLEHALTSPERHGWGYKVRVLVLAPLAFTEWFDHCLETGADYTQYKGVPIVIDDTFKKKLNFIALLLGEPSPCTMQADKT